MRRNLDIAGSGEYCEMPGELTVDGVRYTSGGWSSDFDIAQQRRDQEEAKGFWVQLVDLPGGWGIYTASEFDMMEGGKLPKTGPRGKVMQ